MRTFKYLQSVQYTCTSAVQDVNKEMTAEDMLEQISGILDDDSMISAAKVYMIKDIISSEAVEIPLAERRDRDVR